MRFWGVTLLGLGTVPGKSEGVMGMDSTATGDKALNSETARLPLWLASDVKVWIRAEEARGNGFTSASAAVRHALAEITK